MPRKSGDTEVTVLPKLDANSGSQGNSGAATCAGQKKTNTYEDHGKWMDSYDYDNLSLVWKEGGVAIPPLSINPIHAMFQKIGQMTNCSVSINFWGSWW